jgi:gliding-associated putative ABC transporter substrate-binding component GldG
MIKSIKKTEDLLYLSAVLLTLLLLNIWASSYFFRFDMTEEKRFTITDATISLLKNLDEPVYIDIYLAGDINASFKRLQNAVQETLDEFKVYGGKNIQFRFINPDELGLKEKKQLFKQLEALRIPATTLYDNIDGKRTQKVIYPGAVVSYRNQEEGVLLLKGSKLASPQEQLNQSCEGVEYEIANVIKKLTVTDRKNIGFTEGHNELSPFETADIVSSLSEFYNVKRTPLNNQLAAFDVLIVAQPKSKFSELEKFYLDQYVMNGGKVIFLIDNVQMNLDSISKGGTYAFGYDLNLTDLIFKYGVRVNLDLVQDQQSGVLDIVVGNIGDRANIQQLPFPYYIYLNNYGKHPIVRNLDVIYAKFPSSLDTVKAVGIKKTPLVFSSQYARKKEAPTMVSLDELKNDLNPDRYTTAHIPVAYLLEGSFKSAFSTRFAPAEATGIDFKKEGKPTKIIVFTDGDIIKSEPDKKTGQPLPIDFDKVRRQRLCNKEFMLNALSYLTDENGLIVSRNKEITLRPLDKFRIKQEKSYWQFINLVVPILVVVLFGVIRYYWRRYKFA